MTIIIEGVEKLSGAERYLYPLDCVFPTGSLTVLLGPIRAGKTTTMRLMAGLDQPTAGRILEDTIDVTGRDVRKRNVAMVYQQFINYPNSTVFENIASPIRVAGKLTSAERDARVRALAETLGLTPLLSRLPAQISGGQQQRTALARALAKNATLLLLDEPLVNLDYKLREELRSEMKALFKSGERTTVYATTEPQEALLLGGRTMVLAEGRLIQEGPALEVYRRPANLAAARIVADPPMNFLPGEIAGKGAGGRSIRLTAGTVFNGPRGMETLAAGHYTFGLHAAHFDARGDGAIELPAVVELAEINGSQTLIHGRVGQQMLLRQTEGVHRAALGEKLMFRFNPADLYAFDARGDLAWSPSFEERGPREVRHGAP
jgi:glycerol transport system ATP-binding protein